MTDKEKLIEKALKLSPAEKADMIDRLIKSLDQPDKTIDKFWIRESENRIDAYEKGKLTSVSIEEAFSKYKDR